MANLNDKLYYTTQRVGKAKYTVSYHDGVKKHDDDSDFYDIKIFSNKKDFDLFIKELKKDGYKLNY